MALALVLAMSLILVFGSYLFFTSQARSEMRSEAAALSRQLTNSEDQAALLKNSALLHRVTLIGADGEVLYDSSADCGSMPNHLQREEVALALANGFGESRRESETLGEELLYYALKLPTGQVLRIAAAQKSVLGLVRQMLGYVLLGALAAVMLAAIIARPLTRRLVAPINALDLDEPLKSDAYEELSPMLRRLDQQNVRIREQMMQLKAQRNELDAIISEMREGLIVLDEKRHVLVVNQSASRALSLTDTTGKTLMALCRSEELSELVDQAQQSGTAACELAFDGVWYQVSASLVDGRGMVLLLRDVTQQRRAEEARKAFTANVSHELRTPMTSIGGYAELLMNGMVKPEDAAGFGQRIYDESQRLLTLIEDILRLSKLDEGVTGEPVRVQLLDAAKTVIGKLQPIADKAGIGLTLLGEEAAATGDATLIGEMLYNLVDNAIKYNRTGGSVTVTVESGAAPKITVEDTGVGIPKEHQPHVFERFYRVDKSRSKETGGTGLGLSIVKHAAELLGAELTLSSEVGVGTKVVARFLRG